MITASEHILAGSSQNPVGTRQHQLLNSVTTVSGAMDVDQVPMLVAPAGHFNEASRRRSHAGHQVSIADPGALQQGKLTSPFCAVAQVQQITLLGEPPLDITGKVNVYDVLPSSAMQPSVYVVP